MYYLFKFIVEKLYNDARVLNKSKIIYKILK